MIQPTLKSRAFTLVEVLVVMSMLAILIALVLFVAGGVGGTEAHMRSKHHLREINQFMQGYTASHDGRILPSQFDSLDEQGSEVGGPGSRLAYDLTSNGAEWIDNNNRYVSNDDPATDLIARGTWADLLWVENSIDENLGMADLEVDEWDGGTGPTYRSYRYAAPDRTFYEKNPRWEKNPLRSVGVNSWNWPRWDDSGNQVDMNPNEIGTPGSGDDRPRGLPLPMGSGAWQKDMPGFFAANNFFDSRSHRDVSGDEGTSQSDRFWSEGQIRSMSRSVYLVDSFAGETIGGTPGFIGSNEYQLDHDDYYTDTIDAYAVPDDLLMSADGSPGSDGPSEGLCTQEVDFRYNGNSACLMLYLDGHTDTTDIWDSIWELEGRDGIPGRNIRILDLDKRRASPIMQPGGN